MHLLNPSVKIPGLLAPTARDIFLHVEHCNGTNPGHHADCATVVHKITAIDPLNQTALHTQNEAFHSKIIGPPPPLGGVGFPKCVSFPAPSYYQ